MPHLDDLNYYSPDLVRTGSRVRLKGHQGSGPSGNHVMTSASIEDFNIQDFKILFSGVQ